ncbi:NADH-quinone oxidoreductase subunit C [Propioniciclava soli]|uniref:NADH-quinone oxidoreductase subunit C n=1 Tax=Propioniciclava soli TaxID=2775081 RepID=A0ABZ3C9F8_9ACTN|nr:NADH-quinone oxidoreductase subunit C [Propioniciclava soli]
MSGQPTPGANLPGEEKTVDEPVADNGSAPGAGLEREDAQPSEQPVVAPATRRGMWSDGSPDTSGYGEIVREVWRPTASPRPLPGDHERVVARLEELEGDPFTLVVFDRGELTVHVRRERLLAVLEHLRNDAALRYELCASVSGVHYPNDAGAELHSVYHLGSWTHNRRLRVETTCPDADPHVPSVCSLYPAADWHEREAWDMFGIVYDGHPSLTRILMPDDWVGHPQRKDYPLGGIPVEYKGAVVPPPDQRRTYR